MKVKEAETGGASKNNTSIPHSDEIVQFSYADDPNNITQMRQDLDDYFQIVHGWLKNRQYFSHSGLRTNMHLDIVINNTQDPIKY